MTQNTDRAEAKELVTIYNNSFKLAKKNHKSTFSNYIDLGITYGYNHTSLSFSWHLITLAKLECKKEMADKIAELIIDS